jgi:hypothetical protein
VDPGIIVMSLKVDTEDLILVKVPDDEILRLLVDFRNRRAQ